MRRADFCRAEQTRRRRVAHAPKLSQDCLKAEGDVTGDVFEKDPLRAALVDDTGDVGPEVPGVVGTLAFACGAEGLARVTGQDDVEGTVEDTCIKAAEIIPDRGRGEVSCALGRDEDSTGPVVPFDKGPGVISGFGEHEAHIKASAACAEGQSVPGTKHHAIHATTRRLRRSRVTSPRASISPHIVALIMPLGRYSSELTLAA